MQKTQIENYYKALRTKDPRYDGRFYFGVTTTGIYCRPTCFAKPKKENVLFYRSQAEAEKAGYRPCLRCRPDLSPTSAQWQGTAAVVKRALRIMSDSDPGDLNITDLAERLGLSDRHLRRLFEEHLGVSPIEVAISKRLHFSRMLLSQTQMSITDIAYTSGFNSLRRFNDAFAKTYKKNPREFRKELGQQAFSTDASLQIQLPYLQPYDWDDHLRFLKNHAIYGVDRVQNETYERHGFIGNNYFRFEVRNQEKLHQLQVTLQLSELKILSLLIEKIRHLFDLEHNPHQVNYTSPLFKNSEGTRVPGAFDAFETAVSVILGQLVSVEQGRNNIRKLVETFGNPLDRPWNENLRFIFPTPQVLAKNDVSVIGLPKTRATAIQILAQKYATQEIDLSAHCDLEKTKEQLLAIKGIGPWTAEMIALRCLRDPNAYPGSDLILKRVHEKYKFDSESLAPWRAYAALALWKKFAQELSRPLKETK